MHLGIPALLDFYRAHKDDESLVLVTIIGTEGSTYRKPAAMMLIGADQQFAGMISGGCLEGDLLHHAADVFASGKPKFVTYDMHADEELVWNLGLGCDGVIHLLLQRLDRESGFGFFQQLEESHGGRRAVLLALKIAHGGELPVGASSLIDSAGVGVGEDALLQVLNETTGDDWPEWRYRKHPLLESGDEPDIILINIPPRVRVLVCGAGPDALPVARTLSGLDWEVLVVDHRPAYTKPGRFPESCRVINTRPENLSESLDLSDIDAAVIMSHHLENDSVYLRQLSDRNLSYIGCLGPGARSVRLKEMAGCEQLQVHGPVGLDIGAELPEAIALSLAAEIHAILNKRSGMSLTLGPRS
jgi:xanthine/CO dehydrogenase XdhC/CoxF family maturation factor